MNADEMALIAACTARTISGVFMIDTWPGVSVHWAIRGAPPNCRPWSRPASSSPDVTHVVWYTFDYSTVTGFCISPDRIPRLQQYLKRTGLAASGIPPYIGIVEYEFGGKLRTDNMGKIIKRGEHWLPQEVVGSEADNLLVLQGQDAQCNS